jgi:hypothetical protein
MFCMGSWPLQILKELGIALEILEREEVLIE